MNLGQVLHVMLVVHLPDDFFDQVLERDDTFGTAVLIHDHCHVNTQAFEGGEQPLGAHVQGNAWGAAQQAAQIELLAVVVDRKSTRLNSSHVASSYAVFCL